MKLPYVRTSEPLSYYVHNFNQRGKYQTIQRSFPGLTDAMSTMDIETAEQYINGIASNLKSYNSDDVMVLKSFDDVAQLVVEDYQVAQWSGGMRGITTGWPEIDAATGGYQDGDLNTWAARLGVGKTYLLLYQAFHAAMSGKRTLFISPEVPDLQLVRRMIGILTGINPRLIARGQLSSEVYRRMIETIDGIAGQLPISFAAGSFKRTLPFIDAMTEEFEPAYRVVDAMYLINPETGRKGSNRRESIADVSNGLKVSTTSFGIPTTISVQINRSGVPGEKERNATETSRSRKNPLAHLDVHKIAETDAIAQDSSLVFMTALGDPPNATGTRWIGLKKGREGEEGLWKINYSFSPFNFSVIQNGNQNQTQAEIDETELDEDLE